MENIVKFDKPYKFEGKEYDSLDLSGAEKLTVADLIDVQRSLANDLAALSAMEATTAFAQAMAVKATGKPVEFYKLMPRNKIKHVQKAILNAMDSSQKAEEIKAQLAQWVEEAGVTYHREALVQKFLKKN